MNIIRVSCESNTIEFDTDTGVYVYGLTECDIEDADYMATVTIDGNNVNFSPPPGSPGANARFPYRIKTGQPNPSTFLDRPDHRSYCNSQIGSSNAQQIGDPIQGMCSKTADQPCWQPCLY